MTTIRSKMGPAGIRGWVGWVLLGCSIGAACAAAESGKPGGAPVATKGTAAKAVSAKASSTKTAKAGAPGVAKPISKATAKAKSSAPGLIRVVSSRSEIKSVASQMATAVRAAETALSPAELDIAQRVAVGQMNCELGTSVHVTADLAAPGHFDIESKKFRFRMTPVVSSTGAIRLEDTQQGAVWLQLANKSMLMSQKLGVRLADACTNAEQMAVAAEMEKNPPENLLEPRKSVPVQTLPAAPATPALGSTATGPSAAQ